MTIGLVVAFQHNNDPNSVQRQICTISGLKPDLKPFENPDRSRKYSNKLFEGLSKSLQNISQETFDKLIACMSNVSKSIRIYILGKTFLSLSFCPRSLQKIN